MLITLQRLYAIKTAHSLKTLFARLKPAYQCEYLIEQEYLTCSEDENFREFDANFSNFKLSLFWKYPTRRF